MLCPKGVVVEDVGAGSTGVMVRKGRVHPFPLLHKPDLAGLCWEEGKSPKAVPVQKAAVLPQGW